jgi:hypothetical protein
MPWTTPCILAPALAVLLSIVAQAADMPGETGSTHRDSAPSVMAYGVIKITDAEAERLKDGGWNIVLCSEADLDVLQRHGLKAVMSSEFLNPETLDDPARREKLDAMIARVKGHPALGMYWIVDEPDASRFAALGKLLAYVRERDPAHPGYINLFPTYASNEQLGNQGDTVAAYQEHLRQFLAQAKPDYLSYDHYHFQAGDQDGTQYFLNLALMRQAALDAGLPFMNFLQACTWTTSMRKPRVPELRFLTYTSLAYGASALAHYTYMDRSVHTGCPIDAAGEPTALWYGLRRINREFVALREQLQPLRSLGAYHVGMVPPGATELPTNSAFTLDPPVAQMAYSPPEPVQGMLLGVFGARGKPTHAVVVNLDYREAATTTVVGPGTLAIFNATTRKWLPAPDGARARLHLAPGGGALVRVRSPAERTNPLTKPGTGR